MYAYQAESIHRHLFTLQGKTRAWILEGNKCQFPQDLAAQWLIHLRMLSLLKVQALQGLTRHNQPLQLQSLQDQSHRDQSRQKTSLN